MHTPHTHTHGRAHTAHTHTGVHTLHTHTHASGHLSSGGSDKYHRLRGLNNRHLFPCSSGGQTLRSGGQHGGVSARTLFPVTGGRLLAVGSRGGRDSWLCPSSEGPGSVGFGLQPPDLVYPVAPPDRVVTDRVPWGARPSPREFGGTQFRPQQLGGTASQLGEAWPGDGAAVWTGWSPRSVAEAGERVPQHTRGQDVAAGRHGLSRSASGALRVAPAGAGSGSLPSLCRAWPQPSRWPVCRSGRPAAARASRPRPLPPALVSGLRPLRRHSVAWQRALGPGPAAALS